MGRCFDAKEGTTVTGSPMCSLFSPICPWCDEEVDSLDSMESVDFDAQGKAEVVCGECERLVTVWRVMTVAYTAEKRGGSDD